MINTIILWTEEILMNTFLLVLFYSKQGCVSKNHIQYSNSVLSPKSEEMTKR